MAEEPDETGRLLPSPENDIRHIDSDTEMEHVIKYAPSHRSQEINTGPANNNNQYDTEWKNSDERLPMTTYEEPMSPTYNAETSGMATFYGDTEKHDGPSAETRYAYVTPTESRSYMVKLDDGSSVCNECARDDGLPLRSAVKNGHLQCVKLQLSQSKVDVNSKDDVGFTLFTLALLRFDICDMKERGDICLLFTRNGANVNDCLNDGTTLLHIACTKGRDDIAELLINNGAYINKADKFGFTPLMKAVRHNKVKTCELLLSNNALVNCNAVSGITPLLIASQLGHNELVKLLCQYGASLNARMNDVNEGMTAMMLAICYSDKPIKTVRLLHGFGANVDDRDYEKMTALMHAARKCHSDMVATLHQLGSSVNLQDKLGRTALHWAATNRTNSELVKARLVEIGADEHLQDNNKRLANDTHQTGDDNNASAFEQERHDIHHRKYDRREIWEKVKKREHPDTKNGNTWLHYSADLGYVELFRKLIGEMEIDVDSKNNDGTTPLALAAGRGQARAVEQLLQQYRADVNEVDIRGQTALHVAATENKADVINIILKCPNVDTTLKDVHGNTALNYAASKLSIDAFGVLLIKSEIPLYRGEADQGDQSGVEGVHKGTTRICRVCFVAKCGNKTHANRKFIPNNDGWTPFHCLVDAADSSVAQTEEFKTILECLKNSKYTADVHAIDCKKRNLLHLAVERNNRDIITNLKMLDPEQLNAAGFSPLHMAARTCPENVDSASSLFSAIISEFYTKNPSRDIDHLSADGESALMMCVTRGNVENVKLLFEHGSVMSRTSPSGATVMHKLAECKDATTQSVLFQLLLGKLIGWYFYINPDKNIPTQDPERYQNIRNNAFLELVWKPKYLEKAQTIRRSGGLCAPQYAARMGQFTLLKSFVDSSDIPVKCVYYDVSVDGDDDEDSDDDRPYTKALSKIVDELIWHANEVDAAKMLYEIPFCDMIWSYRLMYKTVYFLMFVVHIVHMIIFSTTVSHHYGREECHLSSMNDHNVSLVTTDVDPYYNSCDDFESWFWLFIIWPSINFSLDFIHFVTLCNSTKTSSENDPRYSRCACSLREIVNELRMFYVVNIRSKVQPYIFSWLFSLAFSLSTALWIIAMTTDIVTSWNIESSALVLFIGWLYAINFMSVVYEQLAILLDVMKNIVLHDVIRISSMYAFILVSFALPFHMLTLRRRHLNSNVVSVWFTMFAIFLEMFGAGSEYQQLSIENEISDIDIVLFRVLFVLYIFIASVVLLNVLIAMMSDSYDDAVNKATESIAVKKLEMARYAISITTLFRKLTNPKCLHGRTAKK